MHEFIKRIEEHYNVRYVGFYDIPTRDSVYVFYQENPKTELGHSHYMGLIFRGVHDEFQAYVCNAKSIVEAEYPAIPLPNGGWLVSRYRHDFQQDPSGTGFIDGGLAYTRYNPEFPPTHIMRIIDGTEVFSPARRPEESSD